MQRSGKQTFELCVKNSLNSVSHINLPNGEKIHEKLSASLGECYALLETSDQSVDRQYEDMIAVLHSSRLIFESIEHDLIIAAGKNTGGFMKKFTNLMTIACLFIFASCSSSPFKEATEKNEYLVQHMQQGKRYIGGEFDPKFSTSGNDGMNLRAVGVAVYPVQSNEALVKAKAISVAKFKLVESAPTQFKQIVQQAIGNALGYTGEFTQIETSITEVHGLQGIEIKEENVVCKMVVEPTIEGGYNNNRECRAMATVPLVELRKSFDFTMESKYGPQKKTSVEKILEEQLKNDAIGSNPVVFKKPHQVEVSDNQ